MRDTSVAAVTSSLSRIATASPKSNQNLPRIYHHLYHQIVHHHKGQLERGKCVVVEMMSTTTRKELWWWIKMNGQRHARNVWLGVFAVGSKPKQERDQVARIRVHSNNNTNTYRGKASYFAIWSRKRRRTNERKSVWNVLQGTQLNSVLWMLWLLTASWILIVKRNQIKVGAKAILLWPVLHFPVQYLEL